MINQDHILYEDNFLLIGNKPAGIPSLATLDPKREHFFGELQKFLLTREKKERYLAIHHRLDVDTSGVLVFCKKKSMNKVVGELFSDRKIEKKYLALCQVGLKKKLENEWTVENFLARSKKNKMKMTSVLSGGDKAITHFKFHKQNNLVALIEASPHTGRMHQIRVHLSEMGLPILGDPVYGNQGDHPRTMLHAHQITFVHPTTLEKLTITAPIPQDMKSLMDQFKLD